MEVEMPRGFLALFQIDPVLGVMVWCIDNKYDLIHVTGIGPDIRSVFEFEDKFVRVAARRQYHARLIVRGAIMRGHQVAAVDMKHRDHFIGNAFVEPTRSEEHTSSS